MTIICTSTILFSKKGITNFLVRQLLELFQIQASVQFKEITDDATFEKKAASMMDHKFKYSDST